MAVQENLLGKLVLEASQGLKGFKRAPEEARAVFLRCCEDCARGAVSRPGARVICWRELVGEEQFDDIARAVSPFGIKQRQARRWAESVVEEAVLAALRGYNSIGELRDERRRHSEMPSGQPEIPFLHMKNLRSASSYAYRLQEN